MHVSRSWKNEVQIYFCGLVKIDEVDEQMTLHQCMSKFIIYFTKFWMNLDKFTTVKVVDF
jgi:hypothetical protein